VPTLLLWGREDQVTTIAFGHRLARELPRARLVEYGGCGHLPMVEAAAASTQDLAAFLAEEQDTGHRTQDTGHRTPDTGHRTPGEER
jgi:alpha-beta hydrolase superfamily lysophospholipase